MFIQAVDVITLKPSMTFLKVKTKMIHQLEMMAVKFINKLPIHPLRKGCKKVYNKL